MTPAHLDLKLTRFKFCAGLILFFGSLAYHWNVPYFQTAGEQLIGLSIIIGCFTFTISCTQHSAWKKLLNVSSQFRQLNPLIIPLLGFLAFVHLRDLWQTPMWLSEAFVINDAKRIISGDLLHPIGDSGDFPSNFMSWPVALVLFLSHDPIFSVRIFGVLSGLLTAYLAYLMLDLLKGSASIGWLAILIPLFSVWMIELAICGDNNWVSFLPLIIMAPYYFLLRAITLRSPSSLVLLAIVCGICFWTLYVPFVFSLIIVATIFLLPARTLSFRSKLNFCLLFLIIASPTIGRVLQFPQIAIGRHVNYIMGGEATAFRFVSVLEALDRYKESALLILRDLYPSIVEVQHRTRGIILEPTLFALMVLGFLTIPFFLTVQQTFLLYFPMLALGAGIVASNPQFSIWRLTALAPFCFFFAVAGSYIISSIGRRALKAPVWITGLFISALHLYFFYLYYVQLREYRFKNEILSGGEYLTNLISYRSQALQEQGYELHLPVPDGPTGIIVKHLRYQDYPVFEYTSLTELLVSIKEKNAIFVTVEGLPAEHPLSDERARLALRDLKMKCREEMLRDLTGRPRSVMFICPNMT